MEATYLPESHPGVLASRFDAACDRYHEVVLGPFHPAAVPNGLTSLLTELDGQICASGSKVLDAGCGIGNLAAWLPRSVAAGLVHGTDLSTKSVPLAAERSVLATASDLEALCYRDAAFDVVVSVNSVFPPARRPVARAGVHAQLTELARVSATGATLILVTQALDAELEALDELLRRDNHGHEPDALMRRRAYAEHRVNHRQAVMLTGWNVTQCLHTQETLMRELPAAGFEVESYERLEYPGHLSKERGYPDGIGAWDHLVVARRR